MSLLGLQRTGHTGPEYPNLLRGPSVTELSGAFRSRLWPSSWPEPSTVAHPGAKMEVGDCAEMLQMDRKGQELLKPAAEG